jgi:hypothetical protein
LCGKQLLTHSDMDFPYLASWIKKQINKSSFFHGIQDFNFFWQNDLFKKEKKYLSKKTLIRISNVSLKNLYPRVNY